MLFNSLNACSVGGGGFIEPIQDAHNDSVDMGQQSDTSVSDAETDNNGYP